MDQISVIGLGKLGVPLLAVLLDAGYEVVGMDVDPRRVEAINAGRSPVDEPGVQDLLTKYRSTNGSPRYVATTLARLAVLTTEATFIIVPTPSGEDGGFTLEFLEPAAREVGKALRQKEGWHLIVIVSTVMPGQTAELAEILEQESGKRCGRDFGLCYSPTFIALGDVVRNLREPDYVLIGSKNSRATDELFGIFQRMTRPNTPMVVMSWTSAEIAKIAQNSYITNKIAFANELSRLCKAIPGANVDDVTLALGLDRRVGPHYLRAGTAYGGPCLPRDNRALRRAGEDAGVTLLLPSVIDLINKHTTGFLAQEVLRASSPGQVVGVLGLSYKMGTPCLEESASIHLISALADKRRVVVYDHLAMGEARRVLGPRVLYEASAARCIEASDVVVLMHNDVTLLDWQDETGFRHFAGKTVIDPWRVAKNALDFPATRVLLGVGVVPA